MAWMIALKKFPYGGLVHEPGDRFFMPDEEYIYNKEHDGRIYQRLFIEEGKAKELVIGEKPALKREIDALKKEIEETSRRIDARVMRSDDAEALLEPKRERYSRRDLRARD